MYIGKLSASSSGLNIQSINRSAAIKNEALNGKKEEQARTDVVAVSPAGKKQSMIEQLMKQKELLQEQKQSLLDSAAENGAAGLDMQLKEYEQQMKDIDQQITQLQSEDLDEKKSEDKTGTIYEEPKTKEEIQKDQLNDLTALSNGTDQAEVITSAKNQLDGRVRVLGAQLQSSNGNSESKIEKIAELESRSQKLQADIGKKLGDSLESISEINENTAKPAAKADPGERDESTDSEDPLSSDNSLNQPETEEPQA